MIRKICTQIFNKSPWDDLDQEKNIFTLKRNKTQFNFNFDFKIILISVLALLALWMCSGIYKVREGEQALVMRFGKYNRIALPGLNYHLPMPFESKIIEQVDKSQRVEVGYRSIGKSRSGGLSSTNDIQRESNMLTGDENIVELNADVMWHINDISQYVFNVLNPQETVKSAAESAMREVIGNTPIASVLSNRKQEIADKIELLIQKILDQYLIGIEIEQVKLLRAEPPSIVINAYRDVQIAKADKENVINQSIAYQNEILPNARGEAAKRIAEAEGYRSEIISIATGDSARFISVYKQYVQKKSITRERLYLETIESILKNSNKVIMGNKNMLPHMALDQNNLIQK